MIKYFKLYIYYTKINKSYFDYQSICLGKETDRNKIDNLNSPLLKYFLYTLYYKIYF